MSLLYLLEIAARKPRKSCQRNSRHIGLSSMSLLYLLETAARKQQKICQRKSRGFMWKVFRKARRNVEYSENPTCSAAFITGVPERISSPARSSRF